MLKIQIKKKDDKEVQKNGKRKNCYEGKILLKRAVPGNNFTKKRRKFDILIAFFFINKKRLLLAPIFFAQNYPILLSVPGFCHWTSEHLLNFC